MKLEYLLDLNNFADLARFVSDITKYISSDVDAVRGRQVIDAKSYVGMISISSSPIKVVLHSDKEDEIKKFMEICESILATQLT